MNKRLAGLILTVFFGVWAFVLELKGFSPLDQVFLCWVAALLTILIPDGKRSTIGKPFKIKSGVKYRMLCDYKNPSDREELKSGDVVEVDHVSCWGGSETWTRYGLVFFKNNFPIFAHIFETIAEEIQE